MQNSLFESFAPIIGSLSAAELAGSPSLNAKLRLAQEGEIEVCYAPFEYINDQARVVIVGITPGRTQMLNALKEARRHLDRGTDTARTLMAAKQFGAFSGAMRPSLISEFDCIGAQCIKVEWPVTAKLLRTKATYTARLSAKWPHLLAAPTYTIRMTAPIVAATCHGTCKRLSSSTAVCV